MSIYTNSSLVMAMQSAKDAAKTITAATNAAPGVFTSVAHGYNDGDVILLSVEGMPTLNKRPFVVYSKATDTFQLAAKSGAAGISTVGLGTFVSGTAEKITLGIGITGVQNFAPSGGEPKYLDTTTVNDDGDKQVVSGYTAMSYGLIMQWDPENAGQDAMIEAAVRREERVFQIKWPNDMTAMFNGSVGYKGSPGGDSQGVTTSPAAVAMTNDPTYTKV